MTTLKFSDGVVFSTDGELRIKRIEDGYYVVGRGMLIPCRDLEDAQKTITDLINKQYHPRKDSFPYRTIEYLYEHGESKNEDIRQDIGLDKFCEHWFYKDRSNYYFACIVARLIGKGVIERTRRGYFRLVPSLKIKT